MSRFDGLCHQAWVRGRRRYGGESLRGDARAEFLEEMLDGANYADQAAREEATKRRRQQHLVEFAS